MNIWGKRKGEEGHSFETFFFIFLKFFFFFFFFFIDTYINFLSCPISFFLQNFSIFLNLFHFPSAVFFLSFYLSFFLSFFLSICFVLLQQFFFLYFLFSCFIHLSFSFFHICLLIIFNSRFFSVILPFSSRNLSVEIVPLFGLVSLFNSISTFVAYLMLKSLL